MRHSDAPVEVKSADDQGRFSALAAVFGVTNRVGDRMMFGSFTETLRKWRSEP